MGVNDVKTLLPCLKVFDDHIQAIALELRRRMWSRFPDCNELIFDGPAALAIGWASTMRTNDTFCSLAIYNNNGVLFGFMYGTELNDPLGLLEGEGKRYRYIRVTGMEDFPNEYAFELAATAYENSLERSKRPIDPRDSSTGATILKSVSDKKRRPNKN